MEDQGTWASRTRKRSEAGCGRPEDGGVWTAKTVKRPPQQPAQTQNPNLHSFACAGRSVTPLNGQGEHVCPHAQTASNATTTAATQGRGWGEASICALCYQKHTTTIWGEWVGLFLTMQKTLTHTFVGQKSAGGRSNLTILVQFELTTQNALKTGPFAESSVPVTRIAKTCRTLLFSVGTWSMGEYQTHTRCVSWGCSVAHFS